ncbi:hypothetical protein ACVWXU_001137 [Streptomyces sp. TE33382]
MRQELQNAGIHQARLFTPRPDSLTAGEPTC